MDRVDWRGERWKREFLVAERRNLSAASVYLSGQVKADVSQPGTLRYAGGRSTFDARRARIRHARGGTVYNFTHSRPGNPPFKQKGRLRASVAWELAGPDRLTGRVGTNVKYGRYLELGTRRMRPRPYLRAALRKWGPVLAQILQRRVGPGGLPAVASNQSRSGHFGAGARKAGYA